MNKHCYRIIFSKTLNRLVVVSELARTAGKAITGFSDNLLSALMFWKKSPDLTLRTAAVVCFIALGIIYVPHTMAQPLEIHADKSAPSAQQPTVLRTANNIPQVNIQTPSAGGVSRNVYSRFDVAEKGAILNNSRKPAGSQLAGWVQANPNLVRGEAKVILNEVNSKDPSQLKGYVEVAGKKADVIIANPSGLHCDGCGVINAGRATLTTGQVELENGNIKGFNVRGGKVKVSGRGMDTSQADYTDIIAGQVKADAGIWAKELKVITGKNKVDRSGSKVVYVGDKNSADSASPENKENQNAVYAVDVSELGGMYANHIHLIATERGIGVNNAGKIGAAAGEVRIDSNGNITNSGYLGAQKDITVAAGRDIANKGTIYTQQGNIKLNGQNISQQGSIIAKGASQKKGYVQAAAKQNIRQNGSTLAENDIKYQAKNIRVSHNATVASGINFTENALANKSDAGKNTQLNAEESAVINGRILSSGSTGIKAAHISLADSRIQSNHLIAEADKGDITASGSNIYTENSATFNTPAALITRNAQLNAARLLINAERADNSEGIWINRHNGDFSLNLKAGLTNNKGQIAAGGRLILNSSRTDNRNGLINAASYQITAAAFDNSKGKLIQRNNNPFTLTVNGSLTNDKGVIGYQLQNSNAANSTAAGLENISASAAANTSTSARPAGQGADTVDTAGKIINTASTVEISGTLNNTKGYILSGSRTTLQGKGKLSNDAGTLNLFDFNWKTDEHLNNRLGTIAVQNALLLHSTDVDNRQGTIQSGKTLSLSTHDLDNRDGLIRSYGNATIDTRAHNLNNSDTVSDSANKGISAAGELALKQINQLDNHHGYIAAADAQHIQAQNLANLNGTIAAGESQSFNVTDVLHNQHGRLYSRRLVLNSGSLVNQQGNITSASTADITVTGGLDNTRGIIAARQNSTLQTNTLNNQDGLIGIEQGGLTLTSAALLVNNRGRIVSQGDLLLAGGELQNNQSGTIKSLGNLAVNIGTHQLNNQQGTLSAGGNLSVQSGHLDNRQGLLHAQKQLTVDTRGQNLDNRNTEGKGILGLSNVTLQNIAQLNNSHGQIQAKHDLSLNAGNINNTENGLLYSNAGLTLTAKSLDNRQGTVQALGNITLAQLTDVNNSNTKNTGNNTEATQGLVGQSVTLQSDSLNNRQGGIYTARALSANIGKHLDNRQGEMLSADALNISGDALEMQNRDGLIASAGKLTINAARMADTGRILTKNDADITLKQDLTLTGGIEAEGHLHLKADNITNEGSLQTGKGLHIQTGRLHNNEKAVLSSNTTVLEADSLTNYGLINGIKTTLKTTALYNLGSGRIYGDHVSIQANELNNLEHNGKSATIAARSRLDLGVGTLTNKNHSSLISLGEIHIGGTLDDQGYAAGKAAAVYNPNGLIEAQGNISINSALVSNTHNYFRTALKLISQETVTEYQGSGDPTIYKEGTPGLYVFNNESDHLRVPTGAYYESWHKYHYLKSVQRTEVLPSEYEPGRIYSGKNITIRGDKVENINSRIIAGGKLDIPASIVYNKEDTGVEIITKAGCAKGSANINCRNLSAELRGYGDDVPIQLGLFRKRNSPYGVHSYWRHHKKGRDSTGHRSADYTPPQEIREGVPLEVAAYKQYSLPAFSNAGISAVNVPQSVDIRVKSAVQNERDLTAAPLSPSDIAIREQQIAINNKPNGSIAQINAAVRTQDQHVTLPRSSLFTVNPQSTAGYIVETDPAFTRYRSWLSSDYMIKALNLNSDNMHKRLGDGFYEQRLVQEQIAQLTGKVYLSAYSTPEQQYKTLMNNGITFANQFQLTPGVALTEQQISRLTSDIVWLVNKTVTLADGRSETVLYPQVYAVVRKNDVNGYGALLSGNSLNIQAAEIHNSGTIAGSRLAAISADNITNRFGRLTADNALISAKQDLVNIGGMIDAAQRLNIQAGQDIIVNTTHRTTTNSQGETTALGAQGGFYLTGNDGRQIWVSARRDIHLTAADIANNAHNALTLIQAGRDILLDTARRADRYEQIHDADNYLKTANRQDIGSTLRSNGTLQLQAAGNITTRATTLSSAGDMRLRAGNRITLAAGEAYHFADSAFKDSSSGMFSKKTVKTRDMTEQTSASGSRLDGSNVTLLAQQGAVNIIGSDVVAEQALNVTAKNISITEAANRLYTEHFRQVSKSGLLGTGGIGFTIGSRRDTTENDRTQYSARQSQVGSLKDRTALLASERYMQRGSLVSAAQGDVSILAKQVDIGASSDNYESHYKHTYEQKGFTFSIDTPIQQIIDTVSGAVKSVETVGDSKDSRINALAAFNAGWTAYRATQSLSQLASVGQAAGSGNNGGASVTVSLTYGEQKNTDRTDTRGNTAAISQVNAGGKVNIIATGAGKQSDSALRAPISAISWAHSCWRIMILLSVRHGRLIRSAVRTSPPALMPGWQSATAPTALLSASPPAATTARDTATVMTPLTPTAMWGI